jgi:peptidyl-prolyl cis-trans isomerase B (cyclophilin B)
MASLQRLVISVLLILTVTFVFFAQATEATKGPKITHKVFAIFWHG